MWGQSHQHYKFLEDHICWSNHKDFDKLLPQSQHQQMQLLCVVLKIGFCVFPWTWWAICPSRSCPCAWVLQTAYLCSKSYLHWPPCFGHELQLSNERLPLQTWEIWLEFVVWQSMSCSQEIQKSSQCLWFIGSTKTAWFWSGRRFELGSFRFRCAKQWSLRCRLVLLFHSWPSCFFFIKVWVESG